MSEPTRDPLQDLENFGTGGIAVNPLDPAAVRRLGDQRRRRQNTMYGAIAAVVVAVAVIPTAILANHDDGSTPPTRIVTPPPPTPSPTAITFPDGGVDLKVPADTEKLVGTSDDFKTFMLGVLQKDADTCATPDVTVEKYLDSGFAVGGVGGCGGYRAVWAIVDGHWKEVIGTQDTWICSDLAQYDVPAGFAGDCYVPPSGPAVITFPGEYGVLVKSAADADKLAGAPQDFKQYIVSLLPGVKADVAANCAAMPPSGGVLVEKFARAGYALGTVDGCHGHLSLWAKQNGDWTEILATAKAGWNCADLDREGIPRSFAGTGCLLPGTFGPDTVGGISLGMTAAQVRAAGGSTKDLPDSVTTKNDCAELRIPGLTPDNQPVGFYSPEAGVVEITSFDDNGWKTPEGIGYGSSKAAVEAAYPNGHEDTQYGLWIVPLSGGRRYEIGIDNEGVKGITLTYDKIYCQF